MNHRGVINPKVGRRSYLPVRKGLLDSLAVRVSLAGASLSHWSNLTSEVIAHVCVRSDQGRTASLLWFQDSAKYVSPSRADSASARGLVVCRLTLLCCFRGIGCVFHFSRGTTVGIRLWHFSYLMAPEYH